MLTLTTDLVSPASAMSSIFNIFLLSLNGDLVFLTGFISNNQGTSYLFSNINLPRDVGKEHLSPYCTLPCIGSAWFGLKELVKGITMSLRTKWLSILWIAFLSSTSCSYRVCLSARVQDLDRKLPDPETHIRFQTSKSTAVNGSMLVNFWEEKSESAWCERRMKWVCLFVVLAYILNL